MAIGAILLARPSLARKSLQDGGEEIYRNGTEGSNPACSSAESASISIRESWDFLLEQAFAALVRANKEAVATSWRGARAGRN